MKYFFSFSILFLIVSCHNHHGIEYANVFKNPSIPPKNCKLWFDGCNKCSVSKQHILACTKMDCMTMQQPRCLKFQEGPTKHEINKKKCAVKNGIWQKKRNGVWICMELTKDVNTPCFTSKDCQSMCLYYKGKTRGFCSRFTPLVGCAQEYENGKHFEVCE